VLFVEEGADLDRQLAVRVELAPGVQPGEALAAQVRQYVGRVGAVTASWYPPTRARSSCGVQFVPCRGGFLADESMHVPACLPDCPPPPLPAGLFTPLCCQCRWLACCYGSCCA
jgi:hypothetical protein